MIRNLKSLGLALVGLLALSAVLASAASAEPPKDARLTLSEYPAKLTGNQTEGASNAIVLPGGRTFKCGEVKYESEYTKAESEAGEVMATPKYENCTATILGNVTPVTVTTNGCTFTFTFGNYINPTEASATNTAHIVCPAEKEIEVHIWQSAEKHTKGEASFCTYAIPPQTVQGTVNFKLSGDGGSHPHTYLTITGKELKLPTVKRLSGTLTNCGAATQVGEIGTAAKIEALNGAGVMLEGTFSQV